MFRRLTMLAAVWVLGVCAQAPELGLDSESESDGAGSDGLMRAHAPMHLLPGLFADAPMTTVAFSDARVEGRGKGLVVLSGPDIAALSGFIDELIVLGDRHDPAQLHPAFAPPVALARSGDHEAQLPAELETMRDELERLDTVESPVEGLRLEGFERAWLVTDVVEPLAGTIVVDAPRFHWDGPSSRVVLEQTEPQGEAGRASAWGSAASGQTSPSSSPAAIAVDDDPPSIGEPCQRTSECTDGAKCIEATPTDPTTGTSPGPTCEAECIDTSTSPAVLRCVDDLSCCSNALICLEDGRCVVPPDDGDGGSSGGNTASRKSGPCGDRDDDDVCNAWDANPDESCRHDRDGDGCNDSFDDAPDDSCNCLTSVPRPNSTAILLLTLVYLRGRGRRR